MNNGSNNRPKRYGMNLIPLLLHAIGIADPVLIAVKGLV
jgi:hypothetical protein